MTLIPAKEKDKMNSPDRNMNRPNAVKKYITTHGNTQKLFSAVNGEARLINFHKPWPTNT